MVFFRDAPRELEEAAYLDGWTPLQAFRKITLPLVLPGMISVSMLCWIFAWNEYLFANLFVGTAVRTYTIVIPTFTNGSQTLWNLQMAVLHYCDDPTRDAVHSAAPLYGPGLVPGCGQRLAASWQIW